jgi:large subunit ribosomal protein L10
MAKTRDQKKDIVSFYKEKLENAKGVYFLGSKGISATDASDMKKALYDHDSYYHIVKNRLFHIALKDMGFEVAEEIKEGQQAVIFASEVGLTEAAKVVKEYIKENEEIQVRLGMLDGGYITKEQVQELADLPSKDEMIARVLATMNAPLTGFVNVLAGNVRSIVNVINALKDQKE